MRRARRGPPATKPPQGRTRADHPAKSR
jgi:hypothetical protein